jgi:hypothetical protein
MVLATVSPRAAVAQETPSPLAPTVATAQATPPVPPSNSQSRSSGFDRDRLYFGGGVGLSFGSVDYVELAPLVGYQLGPQASVGGSLIFRYRNDDRYGESLSTTDFGGSLFGRYHVWNPLFVHAEVEYLSYEYVRFDLSTERDNFTSFFVGPGVNWALGGRTSMFALALYNLAYDSGEPSPYDSPWVVRFGIGVGF